MIRRFAMCALVMTFVVGIAMAGQAQDSTAGSWSGVIINSNCTADEAFAEAPKCTQEGLPGAPMVLYDDTTRQIFDLDPQDPAMGHLGDSVAVSGTLHGNTIRVKSLELMTSIGLPGGKKAPVFALRDQSGREQTLETLKGKNGTVLLFFRSADW